MVCHWSINFVTQCGGEQLVSEGQRRAEPRTQLRPRQPRVCWKSVELSVQLEVWCSESSQDDKGRTRNRAEKGTRGELLIFQAAAWVTRERQKPRNRSEHTVPDGQQLLWRTGITGRQHRSQTGCEGRRASPLPFHTFFKLLSFYFQVYDYFYNFKKRHTKSCVC